MLCDVKQTIIMILSDGWDIGEVEVLENSMQKNHQKQENLSG